MGLLEDFVATARLMPEEFGRFQRHIPSEWIEAALEATGTASLRKRRLPAEMVVWLVVGMAMFRDLPIPDVVRSLDLTLPDRRGKHHVAPSAITQARQRLGAEPMRWLFEQTGRLWAVRSAENHLFHGLMKWAVDGMTNNVPDSPSNRKFFGASKNQRGTSSYPRARIVTLMAIGSRVLRDARIGSYRQSEHELAQQLWPQIPDHSITVIDLNYFGAPILWKLMTTGVERHWLMRGKKKLCTRTVERLGPGDEIVEMEVSQRSRQRDKSLPKTWRFRMIRYHHKGYKPQKLLTSLVDAQRFPARELISLYHERWEIELGNGEIKTDMLDRREAIRSQSPEGVLQELWGVLLAYNLVRVESERIAERAGVSPLRISFVTVLRELRVAFLIWHHTSPGALPRRIRDFEDELARFVLPERRRARRYPRAVKIKMSPYARKRPRQRRRRRLN